MFNPYVTPCWRYCSVSDRATYLSRPWIDHPRCPVGEFAGALTHSMKWATGSRTGLADQKSENYTYRPSLILNAIHIQIDEFPSLTDF